MPTPSPYKGLIPLPETRGFKKIAQSNSLLIPPFYFCHRHRRRHRHRCHRLKHPDNKTVNLSVIRRNFTLKSSKLVL